ncbi:hypothetical protein ABMY33_20360 [Vibrio vulnificus]|uniref:O-antigen polysaccharide polymerase Wzy n=1 Tax=Vibrio vulnificus TaxID=672 RepID=UPI004059A916
MESNTKYLPSAMLFFSFGFLYYLVIPVLSIHFLDDNRYVEIALKHIGNDTYGSEYYIVSLVGFFSFYVALKLGEKIKISGVNFGHRVRYYYLAPKIIASSLLLVLMLSTFKGISSGVSLFSGYSDYNIAILGPYATTLFCSVIFLNYFEKKSSKFYFVFIFLLSSLLLLGLGSRMFFLLGTMSIILNKICNNPKIIKKPVFLCGVVTIFLLVLFVGVWRSQGDISGNEIMGIFIAEPLFTSISSVNYFKEIDEFFVIKSPNDIFAAIINFVPSLMMPDKSKVVEAIGYDIREYSPFGASSLLVNVHINFGILFYIYFCIIGFVFGLLKNLAKVNKLFYSIYLSSLPLLMFHFFREGFITYIKVQFFNAILLPILFVSILGFLLRSTRD